MGGRIRSKRTIRRKWTKKGERMEVKEAPGNRRQSGGKEGERKRMMSRVDEGKRRRVEERRRKVKEEAGKQKKTRKE